MLTYIDKEAKICGNCIHFYQHYLKINGRYKLLHCGHCVYPRLKICSDLKTCPHWEATQE